MTSADSLKRESVTFQSADETASRQAVAHASYMDKHSRFGQFDGALIHGNCLARFEKVLNIEVNGLADIRERLLISVTPGMATLERWTVGVPGVAAILEFVLLDCNFEDVGFHLAPIRPASQCTPRPAS